MSVVVNGRLVVLPTDGKWHSVVVTDCAAYVDGQRQ